MQRQSQIIFRLDSAQLLHWSWQQGSAFKPLFLLFPKQVLRNASRVPVKFLGGSCFGLGRSRLQTQFGELAFVKGRGRSKPGPRRKWSHQNEARANLRLTNEHGLSAKVSHIGSEWQDSQPENSSLLSCGG